MPVQRKRCTQVHVGGANIKCLTSKACTCRCASAVHVCARGTRMCKGYTYVQGVHVCARGTCMCKGYTYVQGVHVCARGTRMCKGYMYMYVLLRGYMYTYVQGVHVCARGTCMCKGYTYVCIEQRCRGRGVHTAAAAILILVVMYICTFVHV